MGIQGKRKKQTILNMGIQDREEKSNSKNIEIRSNSKAREKSNWMDFA